MSQIQRHARVASDFSIARILADDNSRKSRESFFVEAVERYKNDGGMLLLRAGSQQSESPQSLPQQRDFKNTEALDCSKRGARYVDERPLDIYNSPFTSFGTTSDNCESRTERTTKSLPDSSATARATCELKTVKIERNELSWLQCTRYRPPKLPRKSVAGKSGKRRPGSHPRIPFTATQLQVLEDEYRRTAYLSRRDVIQLSTALRLPQSRVKIWFQNRRARDRRESAISDSTILSNSSPSASDKPKAVSASQPMTHNPI